MRRISRLVLCCGALALIVGGLAVALATTAGTASAQAAGGYTALVPTRILDTRNGVGAAQAPVGAGGTVDAKVTGTGGVPDSGVAAVVLNVTATNPSTATFVTVWPTGQPRPDASNLNVVAGESVPNLVIATVGDGGRVSLFNYEGTVDLVADVTGWFPSGGGYTGLTPERMLDTRSSMPVGPGGVRELKVTGAGGVPADGVSAVVLNVTATNPTDATFVTVYPTGQARPEASNLNVTAGESVPNLVIATVGDGGTVSLFNYAGTVDLLADVAGWFPAGADYHGLTPSRVHDSRTGATLPTGGTVDVKVTGVGGVPDSGVGAVVLNVTATNPSAATFVSVYPKGQPQPNVSNLNVVAGQSVPNAVIATVGADGSITLFNYAGTVDVIVDIAGWFPGTPAGNRGHLYYTDYLSDTDVNTVALRSVDMTAPTSPTVVFQEPSSTGLVYGVNFAQHEFVSDNFDGGTIFIRDLGTGVLKDQIAWHHNYGEQPSILWVEASPDGQLVVAEVHDIGSLVNIIGVVDRDGHELSSFPTDFFYESEWLPNGDLVVAYDLPGTESALGVISRADLVDGGSATITRYQTFNDPNYSEPNGLAVSPDGTQLAYQWGGGFDTYLMVVALTPGAVPHQITAPNWLGQGGFSFSPDGTEIVLTLYTSCGAYSCSGALHVVPNHRGAPITPEPGGPTELHLADGDTVSPNSRPYWGP